MSQIKKIISPAVFLILGLLVLAGCGEPNPKAEFGLDEQKHPEGWVPAGHATAAKNDRDFTCTECHGGDLSGGISRVSCYSCHTSATSSAYMKWNCATCHGTPPSGTTAPNRNGLHALHNAFQNVTGVCGTCHNGAGTGSVLHANGGINVSFLSAYNAKSGTAVRNADGTCSKVSCHGGQTTPAWSSGTTIDVNTQCKSCHAFGTTEFNSFFSGEHDAHVNGANLACTSCHDTAKLATGHFTALNTVIMEGPASATVSGSKIVSYKNGSCTPNCHTTRSWY